VPAATGKEAQKIRKQCQRGLMTNLERYSKVIGTRTHARDQIAKQVMHDLQHGVREGTPHLNPIFLMGKSGVVGGVGSRERVSEILKLASVRHLSSDDSPKSPDAWAFVAPPLSS
jgi:hypothetical protein